MNIILTYRKHIIAAAQRHAFVPESVKQANPDQLEILYTLTAILYQETKGYYVRRSQTANLPLEDVAAYLHIPNPKRNWEYVTIGICQINYATTAVEIEQAGILYEPGTFDNPLVEPIQHQEETLGLHQYKDVLSPIDFALEADRVNRVNRLLDPLWAIEYAAANMEMATKRQDYSLLWPSHSRPNESLRPWEKMAGYYARGHFDIREQGENDITHYLNYTYNTRVALEALDVLNIR